MAKKKTAVRPSAVPKGMKLKRTKKGEQAKCARNSTRYIIPPGRNDVRIVLCCPVSKWRPKKKTKTADGRMVQGHCEGGLKQHAKKYYGRK